LANENEEKFVLFGVDVREHAQLLELGDREILRLVDDQYNPASFGIALDQNVLKSPEGLDILIVSYLLI